jgi:hypothetical protein
LYVVASGQEREELGRNEEWRKGGYCSWRTKVVESFKCCHGGSGANREQSVDLTGDRPFTNSQRVLDLGYSCTRDLQQDLLCL